MYVYESLTKKLLACIGIATWIRSSSDGGVKDSPPPPYAWPANTAKYNYLNFHNYLNHAIFSDI